MHSIVNREQKLEAVYETIEHDLELIGSTAIEDKLQEGVYETIKFMREAGMKVWMLTGDKVETAVTIGHSSGLLDEHGMVHYFMTQVEKEGLKKAMTNAMKEMEGN